jgi:hypothetical protein
MRGTIRRPIHALAAAVGLSLLVASSAAAMEWTDPARVSDVRGSQLSALHELAGTPSALHLVHGRIGPEKRDDALVYQRSGNGGRTWSAERSLFASTAADRVLIPNFAVATQGDLVIVAWRTRGPQGTSLWIRRSTDGGQRWRPSVQLVTTALQRGVGVPALTIAGTAVIASWTDRADGAVVVRRSTDSGATWGATRRVGAGGLVVECGTQLFDGLVGLASAGPVVHLAWSDAPSGACISTALRVRTSLDGGRTWGPRRTASTARTYGWPELAARGKRLLLSVQQPDDGFLVVHSRDTGGTFAERRFAPAADERSYGAADVLLPGGSVAWLAYADLVYEGDDVVASRIRFRASADSGATWGPASNVLRDAGRLRQATNLAARGSLPVVVFQSGRVDGSTADILVTRGVAPAR